MENRSNCKTDTTKRQCIHVLALGGTISSLAKDSTDEFYHHPSTDISDLLLSLQLDEERLTIIGEQFLQKISHEITHSDLINLAKKINTLAHDESVDGIVVTQGTNCIEEIAYFINLVVSTRKPIVFTGSFRPHNSLGFDGNRNLYNAILLASSKKAISLGVLLTFNDQIINAKHASKLNPSVLGDFSSNHLGVMGFVLGKKVIIQQLPNYKHTYLSEFSIADMVCNPRVYVIYGHLGMDSLFVDVAIKNKAQGIISAGMGKGYQPKKVTEALIRASRKGIVVVRCSRTGQGTVNSEPNFDGQQGFIAGGSLSPQKASILLSVALRKTQEKKMIQRFFDEY